MSTLLEFNEKLKTIALSLLLHRGHLQSLKQELDAIRSEVAKLWEARDSVTAEKALQISEIFFYSIELIEFCEKKLVANVSARPSEWRDSPVSVTTPLIEVAITESREIADVNYFLDTISRDLTVAADGIDSQSAFSSIEKQLLAIRTKLEEIKNNKTTPIHQASEASISLLKCTKIGELLKEERHKNDQVRRLFSSTHSLFSAPKCSSVVSTFIMGKPR